jgi:3-dehydroquinate dehydratase / shikimate dehydrogenase
LGRNLKTCNLKKNLYEPSEGHFFVDKNCIASNNSKMKKYNICVPVAYQDYDEFVSSLVTIQDQNDFVELRLDYIKDLNEAMVENIFQILKVKAIATCRSKDEGGKWSSSEVQRLQILSKCLMLGFDYVDIELKTAKENSSAIIIPNSKPKKKKNQQIQDAIIKQKPVLDLNTKHPNTQIILSYHNFESTDNYRNLRKIQNSMEGFHCDIKKIVCQANSNRDIQIMTRLLVSKSQSEKMIVLSMGEYGSFTRVYNLVLGNYLTFATVEGLKTAKGQMTATEVTKILSAFKINN